MKELKVKHIAKGIWMWERLKFRFAQAHSHYLMRTGKPLTENQFIHYLISHGSELELRRKRQKGE